MVYGNGGPFASKSKRRVVPTTDPIRPLIEAHFGLYEPLGVGVRTVQRLVKRIANRAKIPGNVTRHVGRHTYAVTGL